MKPELVVVVLNYNNPDDTIACVGSVVNATRAIATAVVVVDNGSNDDSSSRLRTALPTLVLMEPGDSPAPAQLCLVLNDDNLGYGRGNNVGIRLATSWGAPYVWILNNDTQVDPAAPRALLHRMADDPTVGALGAAIYTYRAPHNLIEMGGRHLGLLTSHAKPQIRPTTFLKSSRLRLGYVSGASILFRVAALPAEGAFDPAYFLFYEEVDVCRRIEQTGFAIGVESAARVFHRVGATTGAVAAGATPSLTTNFHTARSAIIFYRKHFPWLLPIVIANRALLAGYWIFRDIEMSLSIFRGVAAGLRAALCAADSRRDVEA